MNLALQSIAERERAVTEWADKLAPLAHLGETDDVVDAVKTAAAHHVSRIRPTGSPRERFAALVDAEQIRSLFEHLRGQRTGAFSDVLLLADAVARDAYRVLIRAALSLGVPSDQLARFPSPMVSIEPMDAPVTFVRARDVAGSRIAPTSSRVRLPFPVVLVPPYGAQSPANMTLVLHEVGHDFDEDFDVTASLRGPVASRLRSSGVEESLVETWGGWLREIVADTIGAFLAGAPLAEEMVDWVEIAPSGGATHPPTSLRVRWIEAVLRAVGGAPVRAELPDGVDADLVDTLPAVLDVVLAQPLPRLANHGLGAVAPDAHTVEVAIAGATGLAPFALDSLPLHLVPSVARRACAGGRADVKDVIVERLSKRSRETGSAFRFDAFRQNVLSAVVAPIIEDRSTGLKVPPDELFERVRRVSFVGATNDRLAGLLARYRDRMLPRKELVEVYFLSVRALRGLAHPGLEAAAYVASSATAAAELNDALLDSVAARWVVCEHDEPFVFASYWDADAPGGRIHMSAHAWGQNVKVAPAIDYFWSAEASVAPRAYQFYNDGLAELRRRARRVRASKGSP